MTNSLREELQHLSERCVRPIRKEAINTVTASKGWRHESEPYNSSPRAGGVVHDDALYPDQTPQRGAEFFDDSGALQLPEETQVRISRWIFDNNERGQVPMLDQAKIERFVNLPPLRMEQQVERLRFNRHRLAARVNPTRDRIDDEQTALFLPPRSAGARTISTGCCE